MGEKVQQLFDEVQDKLSDLIDKVRALPEEEPVDKHVILTDLEKLRDDVQAWRTARSVDDDPAQATGE